MTNKYVRLASNTGIVFLGNAGSKLLVFLMLPFYTRYFSPQEYGVFDLIVTYATMFLGVATCQIQDAIFVFPKDEPRHRQAAYFTSGLLFLGFMYILVALVFVALYHLLPERVFLRKHLWLILGYLLLSGAQAYLQQFSRSIDKMVTFALSGVMFTFGTAALALFLIPRHPHGSTLIYANYGGLLLGIATSFLGAKMWRYFTFAWSLRLDLRPLLRYSLPLIPTGIMWWAFSCLNRPILERYASLAAVGIFAVGLTLPSILNTGWSVIGVAWQISVLEECKKDDFTRFYNRFLDFLFAGAGCLVIALTIASPYVMKFLVAPEYYQAWRLVPMLSLGAMFSISAGAVGAVFAAAKKSKYFLYSSLCSLTGVVILNFLLIPVWGVVGAAVANLSALMLEFVVRASCATKFVAFHDVRQKLVLWILTAGSVGVSYAITRPVPRAVVCALFLFGLLIWMIVHLREAFALIGKRHEV